MWCVLECDQVKMKTLHTCCEQVGRRGKDYDTINIFLNYGLPAASKDSNTILNLPLTHINFLY
jgi:hypothetical protein